MDCYHYELPTTGALSFTEICVDDIQAYTTNLSSATVTRAALRAALKQIKRTDGDKDYLYLLKIIEDYLPHLYAVVNTVRAGDITFKKEPVFRWRTTLTSSMFQASTKVLVVGLTAELAFTLLTYSFVLSNLARSTVISLGNYEHDRHITDTERRNKDEKLNFAVNLLSRASGVFLHVSQAVLPHCAASNPATCKQLPDMNGDVITALSHLALADAQNLTIRKLMSKSAYDSMVSPGPPLPKSHPTPALIAKLCIHAASGFSSARSLAKTPSNSNISSNLRRYLSHEATLAQALAYKWLGIDAGEARSRTGDAIAFLRWAKTDLETLRGDTKSVSVGKRSENKKPRKSRVAEELESVLSFLQHYNKMNDTVHFQTIPPVSELQSSIPTGKTVVSSKTFEPPLPAFTSKVSSGSEQEIDMHGTSGKAQGSAETPYALAGSYY